MVYTITVMNEQGKPLQGAAVALTGMDDYGWNNFTTDETGKVYIDESVTGDLSGVAVQFTVSKAGYEANTWHNEQGLPSADISVVLESAPATSKVIPIALGASMLFFLTTKRKNKVGAINFKNDVAPYIIPGALLIGGYLIFKKISDGLGITDSAEKKARAEALDNDIAAAGAATMSDSEIAATATALKEDLTYNWIANNFVDATRQLRKPRNTADILKLLKAYGTQIITNFGIPTGSYTLEETVVRQMYADDIKEMNAYYDAQGIDFNF